MGGKTDAGTIVLGATTTGVLTTVDMAYWTQVFSLCIGALTVVLLLLRVGRILTHWRKWWRGDMDSK